MRRLTGRRLAALVLAGIVAIAAAGWVAARQIRSPAQVAADTAAPTPSPITVPAARRTLATEVIVRGTVRYGAPQTVVLATSGLKQASQQGVSDIVTRPPRRRAKLGAGQMAMTVDGRPVFVLPGSIPMHRDLGPGDRGPDVRQLEQALLGLGFSPGAADGRYDAATESAVSAMYLRHGWDPFGPTNAQLDQLRTAQAAAATARDAHLQALNAIDQAQQTPTRAEVAQARIDSVTARDAVDTAVLGERTAVTKLQSARTLAATAPAGPAVASATARRDQAVAAADVAAKRTALNAAVEDERIARLKAAEVAPDATASEVAAAQADVRKAGGAIAQAQAELDAAIAAADAATADGANQVQKARTDAAQAALDVRSAEAELRRAHKAIRTARLQARLAKERVRLLRRRTDTRAMQAIASAAAQEERRTRAEAQRLATKGGVQVPANEVLFFPTLPLRVDTVKAKRGSAVSGAVMNVTNSRLAIDSSLTVSDAKLVHAGDPVAIEDQDLGIKLHGKVSRVADTPGTNRVDPSRFYLEVAPQAGSASLVGASVKLTIAVKSTKGAVLVVPVSALSLGASGNARVQVSRRGHTRFVTVVPGLAANGLAEVRPAARGQLVAGDLVIVGTRRR
jgi:peptidoglycan hydrolase-like protein with peptidoglycan-binding domain